MKEKALEILKKFEDNGYDAYIVGGYVRDLLLQNVWKHFFLGRTICIAGCNRFCFISE